MMEWFTADSHFEHKNIIEHCNRPFSNINEMNKVILDGINSVVAPEDTLYHLGDFAWKLKNIVTYRRLIRCRNVVLILGNHDPHTRTGQPKEELLKIFNGQVYIIFEIRPLIGTVKQPIVLSHYAMRTWNKSHHGAWHLFGHSHATLSDNGSMMSLDVGVDNHNFVPISIDYIEEIMRSKKAKYL